VSSEKHDPAAEAGADEGGGDAAGVVTVTVVGSYCPRPASLPASIRLANSAKVWRFRTLWRLYSCNTLLEGLTQDLQDVASELRQFIQPEHAVVRPRPLARQWHLAATDQPHIGNRVMGGATRARGDLQTGAWQSMRMRRSRAYAISCNL
jgi:hypothetical protein